MKLIPTTRNIVTYMNKLTEKECTDAQFIQIKMNNYRFLHQPYLGRSILENTNFRHCLLTFLTLYGIITLSSCCVFRHMSST